MMDWRRELVLSHHRLLPTPPSDLPPSRIPLLVAVKCTETFVGHWTWKLSTTRYKDWFLPSLIFHVLHDLDRLSPQVHLKKYVLLIYLHKHIHTNTHAHIHAHTHTRILPSCHSPEVLEMSVFLFFLISF